MTQLNIPFNGPAYKSESSFVSHQECVNFYLRPYPELGAEAFALFGTPGLELFVTPGVTNEVRAILPYGGYNYVVIGNSFYKVSSAGVSTLLGTLNTSTGPVDIATNGLDITIVDGSNGYYHLLSGSTLSDITDPNFPGGNNIVQVDGYYLVNRPGTGQIWRSDINDGNSWNGLAFSTAGGDPDAIISLIVDHLDVWIIGELSTEIWRNVGTGTFNFARVDGAFIEQGGVSHFARAKANNAVYWLGNDENGKGQVFQAIGRQPKVISTFPISFALSSYETLDDAVMFSYQQLGHTHIVLTFPSANRTWVYDSTVGEWHQRSSRIAGVDGRWRVNCHSYSKDTGHVVGDFTNGNLYFLKTDVYDENGEDMIATRTTSVIRNKQNRITVNEVHVVTEPAVGISTGSSEDMDPQGLFSCSKDGGRNFSPEFIIALGKIGEYENRANIHQLGQGVNWSFRVVISAAIKRVIIGAVMDFKADNG